MALEPPLQERLGSKRFRNSKIFPKIADIIIFGHFKAPYRHPRGIITPNSRRRGPELQFEGVSSKLVRNYHQGIEFGTPKVCIKCHVSPQSYTGHIQSYYGKVTCLVSNEYFSFYSMYIDLLGEHKTESKVRVGQIGTLLGNLEQYQGQFGTEWNKNNMLEKYNRSGTQC